MNTADMQRTAFDAVDMTTPISELVIAALIRNFAIAAGKRRLIDAVDAVAQHLVELGVETCGDLRSATYSMYVDDCAVKPIDAGRLVAHFAPPEKVEKVVAAPRGLAQGVCANMQFVAANRVADPDQGLDNDVDRDDGHDYDERQRSEAVGDAEGEERSAL